MFSRKSKTQFNRPWSAAGVLGSMVLLVLVSDHFSGPTAQALSGCSPPNFSAPNGFPTGQNSAFVAVGDFNKDGKQDLVVPNQYFQASDVSLLLGDGNGGFGAAKHFPVGRQPSFIVAADFNGDQNLDFATANSDRSSSSAPGTVSVRLGDGKGDFGPVTNFPTGSVPSSLATRDFNNDGKLDLAVGYEGSAVINEGPFIVHPGGVSVWLGDGAGGFTQSHTSEFGQSAVKSIAAGDLNGDGNLDLALGLVPAPFSSGQTRRMLILIGNGAGKFTITEDIATTSSPVCVLFGDFNHDGKLDLVNVDSFSGDFHDTITIRLGNGTGSFGSPTSFTIASNPQFAAAGDVDMDGNLDLVVANGNVYVTLGDGNGSFGPPTQHVSGFNRVATGDLNNDGKLDLALILANTVEGTQTSVSVVLNTCNAPQLLTIEQSNRAVALDSVTMIRNPFPFTPTTNFSSDQRTRITLFATNVDLQPGEDAASVLVRGENSQHAIFSLPVEFVGKVPNFPWLTQVNVRLPDELANGGDVSLSLIYRGLESNKVLVTIQPPAN